MLPKWSVAWVLIVDAKDEGAERFHAKYDFETIAVESWPRRMFVSSATLRSAFADE